MTDQDIPTELHELRNDVSELRADVSEVVKYVKKLQSDDYKNAEDVKQFAINLAANVLVDGMEERAKDEIRGKFNRNNK